MIPGSIKRWMYRGDHPNWLARLLNNFWKVIHSSGIIPSYATLEVVGRKSGRLISMPVVVANIGGERYLVSMLGSEAQWVLNVRAAQGKAFIRSGRRTAVRLVDVPVERRAPLLKAYLQIAPGSVRISR
jgi:deazaflavin-dependent oxidoreductase (nitroreductase family)